MAKLISPLPTERSFMIASNRRAAFFLLASLGSVSAAWAHHSFSNFDMSKTLTIAGTVRAFEWTNPHVWLWIDVPDSKGGSTAWGLEGAAVGEMARQTVVFFPTALTMLYKHDV